MCVWPGDSDLILGRPDKFGHVLLIFLRLLSSFSVLVVPSVLVAKAARVVVVWGFSFLACTAHHKLAFQWRKQPLFDMFDQE